MSGEKKVSVIVPAYNSEKFIEETLNSLNNQILPMEDFEVIVINDGSTDKTQEIIDSYCKKRPNIRSIYQENAGVSAARNRGLDEAIGDYVVFLDADDLLYPESLEAFYLKAERSGADLVIGKVQNFGAVKMSYNDYATIISRMEEIDNFDILLLWNFLVGNKCYRRKTLIESGVRFPPLKYCEEGAFFMQFVYTGAKITGTPYACMCYRRHSQREGPSVSQSVNIDLAKDFISALNLIYDKAKLALEGKNTSYSEFYLQEIAYKTLYILVEQFYRHLWNADSETMEYIKVEYERLKVLTSERHLHMLCLKNKDIHLPDLIIDKERLGEKPLISVIIGKNNTQKVDELIKTIYAQSMPTFEVILPKSMVAESLISHEYLKRPNLKIVDDARSYKSMARRAAKAKFKLHLNEPIMLDSRMLRLLYNHRKATALGGMLFNAIGKSMLVSFETLRRAEERKLAQQK